MVHITKVRRDNKLLEETQWNMFMSTLQKELSKQGFDFIVKNLKPYNSFSISDVRLSSDWIKTHGYNVSPYSGRRGRILGWEDWVRFNNTVNTVMDKQKISANAQSLHGKFMIRKGGIAFTEEDWEPVGEENVGSMMNPVSRKEAWHKEND